MDKTQIFLLISVLFIFSIMQGCIIPDMTDAGNSPKPAQAAAPEPAPVPEAGTPAAPAAVEKPIMAFISVGMGESTLLLSDNGSILVDAGPDPDAASVIGVLSKYGVKKIDMLVITRPAPGHYAGAPTIIKGFSVPWIVENGASGPDDYNSMIVDATKNRIMVEDAYLGWAQTVDGWELKALNPQRTSDGIITNISKDSIVLMAKKDGACAILMSDTEGSGSGAPDAGTAFGGTESKIAALPGIEGCQILRVGAYGSGNSASSQLLNIIKPKYGIISVGINTQGLPQDAALIRMNMSNMTVFRTDKQGTILVFAQNGTISVNPMAG